jgi:hypothetical protein
MDGPHSGSIASDRLARREKDARRVQTAFRASASAMMC